MNLTLKSLTPYLIILLGLLLLFLIGQAEAAGVCFVIGIAMVIERIWPEQWGAK